MKKLLILSILLLLIALPLAACSDDSGVGGGEAPGMGEKPGDTPGDEAPTEDGYVDLLSDEAYRIVFNPALDGAEELTNGLIATVTAKTGKEIKKYYPSAVAREREIVIGTVSTRQDSIDALLPLEDYDNSDISVYSMRFYGERLVVSASDKEAYSYAIERLSEFVSSDGFKIPEDIDECIIFDSSSYAENGRIKEYTVAELKASAYLSAISADGQEISDFKKGVKEYIYSSDFVRGYPEISATPWLRGIEISVDQPTSKNGGVATVTATSIDGSVSASYKVNIIMEDFYLTSSEVVNKGGAKGVVTIVLDDGIMKTAQYVEELLGKYPEMTVTFAMITNKAASFELNEDKTEYIRDENGNFVIVQNEAQKQFAEYWRGLLERFPRVEITSHSHTHSYAGEDDTVLYTAYDVYGNKYVYPKGSISAEVYGSQQILKVLFGQDSPGFILPGIASKDSGFTTNSWLDFIKSGAYLSARGTTASTNVSDMIMLPSYVENENLVWRTRAFMVRYFNMALNEQGKFYPESVSHEDAIANGVSHATDFIDSALDAGGWACFCFHAIIESGSSGTHPVILEQADALFAHANALAEKGDAWVATYGDAIRYYCEWAEAVTEAKACREESIEVSVKTETQNEHYVMPLTVKVGVPESWQSARFSYGGEETELPVLTDTDGSRYVLCDILPNGASGTLFGEI